MFFIPKWQNPTWKPTAYISGEKSAKGVISFSFL